MEYRFYLILGTLVAGALLYGVWHLVKRFGRSNFVIPGEPTLPGGGEVPDEFICLLLEKPRGGEGIRERESRI